MRLTLVDDHPIAHYGIELILNQIPHVDIRLDKCFKRGDDLLNKIPEHSDHVLLIDIQLPDISGFELTEILRGQGYPGKILIYSSYYNQETILKALRVKANGIVSKTINAELFISTLKKVIATNDFVCVSDTIQTQSNYQNKKIEIDKHFELTEREKEVFELIVKGTKNKEIARLLHISNSTVEFHRKNIYGKLDVRSIAELMQKVYD